MTDHDARADADEPNAITSDGTELGRGDARREWPSSGPPSVAVVEAVADAIGVDPLDLPPLQERLDADALDALVTSVRERTGADAQVSFSYGSARVVVEGNGAVDVRVDAHDDG